MSLNTRTSKILAAALNNEENTPYTEEDFNTMPLLVVDSGQLFVPHDNIVPVVNESSDETEKSDNAVLTEELGLIFNDFVQPAPGNPIQPVSSEAACIVVSGNVSDSDKNPPLKLVDYDSDSSTDDENSPPANEVQGTRKILLLQKRMNSDVSYFSGEASSKDSDFEFEADRNNEMDLVGEGALRKKRVPNKRAIRKSETNLGKGKQVREIPCKRGCQNKCSKLFTESQRHDIHEFYWGLGTYERQRSWLLNCCENVPIRRRKQLAMVSNRQNSFKYFITWDDKRVEVCQQFLLKTLDISQMVLRYAVAKSVQNSVKPDQRGRHEPHNKTKTETKEEIHSFIKSLPAVPSHYCRNHSERKYLPTEMKNVGFLYRIFLRHQEAKQSSHIPSLKIFRNIFLNDFNLGFHLPKKDKCQMCESRKDISFVETEISEELFAKHTEMKEQSKELFLEDQKRFLTDTNYLCASFDLEKVLNTPHGDNMLLYYSRKYAFYNETIYESGTRNGYCYVWGESDGNRGCNEICTVLFKFLSDTDKKNLQYVCLYCDSCSGQNRNRAMLAMLQKFLQETAVNIKTIKIVFLLPGHTYMPVDSVHATIERSIKNRIIWAPSEWDTILTNARINPKPLEVIRMQFSDFKNWKKHGEECLPVTTKTSEGQIFKISQLRQAYFTKGESTFKINYNYDRNTGIHVIPGKSKGRRLGFDVISEPLYHQKLPISSLKKANLGNLCQKNVIPIKYHDEYFTLKSKATVRDVLPETDEEDEQENEAE